jgi:hypothetical protein
MVSRQRNPNPALGRKIKEYLFVSIKQHIKILNGKAINPFHTKTPKWLYASFIGREGSPPTLLETVSVVFFYGEAYCLSFYYISISFTYVQHFLRGTSKKKMMVSFRKKRKFCGSSFGEKGKKTAVAI